MCCECYIVTSEYVTDQYLKTFKPFCKYRNYWNPKQRTALCFSVVWERFSFIRCTFLC